MWTPTSKILRNVAALTVLGLMLSMISAGYGSDAHAADSATTSDNVACICDVNKNGLIDRSEAVDGVTSYLVQINKSGLGRPLTRPEAVDLVTKYLLSIQLDCPIDSDLIAHWKFEESPSATSTEDATGNGHTGQVNNTVSVPGAVGKAFEFNGSDSVVVVPDSAGFDGVDELTVQAWVYPTGDHSETVIGKWGPSGGADDSWMIQLQTGGVLFVVSGFNVPGSGENSDAFTTEKLPLNTWTHVTGVYKNGEFTRLYLNGILKADASAKDGPVPDSDKNIAIGAQHPGSDHFKGCIDEVKIWDKVITPSAVTPPTTGCEVADVETFSLGGQPNDITFDGKHIWVTNAPSGKVTKLDLNGTVLLSIQIGQTPMGIDSDGRFVWVSDANDSKLRKLNRITGAVECEVTIASSLNGVMFDGRDI
jgi:hypothetical protein